MKVVKEDPGDDKYIECAVALKAEFLITGDKALKALREYMGIKILSPQEFLKIHEII
jgi:predicted nucleic acid-binding protein